LDFFYMPNYSWIKEHPELGLEVVALELNHYMRGWNPSLTEEEHEFEDCQYTSCEENCLKNAKIRAKEAFQLFEDRSAKSPAKNLLVFSHYPTDYFRTKPGFLAGLRDVSKHKIFYIGGHRHNTDNTSTTPTDPNTNWLVGGGGGWSCDGPQQGFLVIEVSADYKLTSYPVLVDKGACCPPQPPPSPWNGPGCEWHGCDNCILNDPKTCECRRQNPDGPCTPCPDARSNGMVCSGWGCNHSRSF
jgi:hypothetical protein